MRELLIPEARLQTICKVVAYIFFLGGVLQYSEARVRERETARAEQNREQRESVLQRCQKPPPLQLCQAAVSLEAIITWVVYDWCYYYFQYSTMTIAVSYYGQTMNVMYYYKYCKSLSKIHWYLYKPLYFTLSLTEHH